MTKELVHGVASTIKLLRVAKQLSQEELADKAGLDRTYISGVERGVRNITLDSLESIVNALDVDVSTFLATLNECIVENSQ
ncbi:helix-turn-helix domain-containing protein [Dokdonella sp.]|uniref:helix-turn-helix domain-containing protein n=1 Tax=Dokdonella sp. TaxID=2291710 RepID=UPI0031BCE161|nr:helix-turn-helix domain-containing protein [Dokdonella sp.]